MYDTGCYRVYRRAELVRATIIAMEKRDFAVLVFQGDFSETTCQVPVEIFVSTVNNPDAPRRPVVVYGAVLSKLQRK